MLHGRSRRALEKRVRSKVGCSCVWVWQCQMVGLILSPDETDASTPHSQHQHTPKQATPTDPHDNRGSAPSTTESESENAIKEEGKEEEELAEGRQEVSDQEKVPEVRLGDTSLTVLIFPVVSQQVEGAGSDSGIPHRDTRVGPVCRHFLQGMSGVCVIHYITCSVWCGCRQVFVGQGLPFLSW